MMRYSYEYESNKECIFSFAGPVLHDMLYQAGGSYSRATKKGNIILGSNFNNFGMQISMFGLLKNGSSVQKVNGIISNPNPNFTCKEGTLILESVVTLMSYNCISDSDCWNWSGGGSDISFSSVYNPTTKELKISLVVKSNPLTVQREWDLLFTNENGHTLRKFLKQKAEPV